MARKLSPLWVAVGLALSAALLPARAQAQSGWQGETPAPGSQQPPANTTGVPRSPGAPGPGGDIGARGDQMRIGEAVALAGRAH